MVLVSFEPADQEAPTSLRWGDKLDFLFGFADPGLSKQVYIFTRGLVHAFSCEFTTRSKLFRCEVGVQKFRKVKGGQ